MSTVIINNIKIKLYTDSVDKYVCIQPANIDSSIVMHRVIHRHTAGKAYRVKCCTIFEQ